MTSGVATKGRDSGSRPRGDKQASGNPFWNLIQLDPNTIDKELDTAAVRAYERLTYARHGRLRPLVDSLESNAGSTVDGVTGTSTTAFRKPKGNSTGATDTDRNLQLNSEDYERVRPTQSDASRRYPTMSTAEPERDQAPDTKQCRPAQPESKSRPPQQQRSHRKSRSKQGKKSGQTSQSHPQATRVDAGKRTTNLLTSDTDSALEAPRRKETVQTSSSTGGPSKGTKVKDQGGSKEATSTLPTEANVQFIWAKTVPTKSTSVTLVASDIKAPIPLQFVPAKDAYLSAEVSVPCRRYRCCLLVDNHKHQVEPVDIKHYTFEVDLYIEEDDDTGPASLPTLTSDTTLPTSRTTRSLSLSEGQRSHDSQSEEAIRWSEERLQRAVARVQGGDASRDEATARSKSAPGILRNKDQVIQKPIPVPALRGKPTGKSKMDDVMEGEDGPEIRHSSRLEMLLRQQMASGDEDGFALERCRSESGIAETSNLKGNGYPGSIDRLHDQFCDGFKPVPAKGSADHYTSSLGSKQSIASSEQELAQYLSDGGRDVKRDAARREVVSAQGGSLRPRSGSRSRSADPGASRDGQVNRVNDYQSQDSTPTPNQRGEYSYANQRDDYAVRNGAESHRDSHGAGGRPERSHHGITSSTPPRDHRAPQDFHSMAPSYPQDRPRDGYDLPQRLTPISGPRSERDQGYMEYSSRGNQVELSIKTPHGTNRTTPVTTKELPSGREDQHRMQDLEETVVTLRRVLSNRERDLNEIQSEKSRVSEELSRLRQVYETPTEGRDEKEKRINQLIREKENLTTEVCKWKRECEQREKSASAGSAGSATSQAAETDGKDQPDNLDNYDPDNPRAQKRKLEDLESQIQDLTEAHEATVGHLHTAERTAEELKEENRRLRMSSRQTIAADPRSLQDELSRLQNEDDTYMKDELSTVRQELGALRDKNRQLMADNIKLTEHLKRYDANSHHAHRENKHPDPLLDRGPDSWSPAARSNHEDDEHFTRERRRLTHELRGLTTPPMWSDRDYRNHGDEGPYIRTANHNPYSRRPDPSPKSADRFSSQRIDKGIEADRLRSRDDEAGRRLDRHTDTDRHVEADRRLDTFSDHQRRDDYNRRPSARSQDQLLVNGHGITPPPAMRRERRLSEKSDSTVELTDASPLGEHRQVDSRVSSDNIHREMVEEPLRRGPHITPGLHQLTSEGHSSLPDLPPPKKRNPISDVLDNLPRPSESRHRLKVDLVKDVIDNENITVKEQSRFNPFETSEPNYSNGMDVLHMNEISNRSGHQVAAHMPPGPSSSTHRSVLDDLLDNSVEDLGSKPRRDSLDSDSTEVILGIADEEVRKYNLGNDPGSDHQMLNGTGRGLHHGTSLRSFSPRPIITQHNKAAFASHSQKESIHSCTTKRPFAPRVAADINIGDVVKFCRHGGKISKGLVKYIGHLPGKNDTYLGMELEHEMGKHDGVYEGQRYFQSKPNRGVFVAFSKVVMAWGE